VCHFNNVRGRGDVYASDFDSEEVLSDTCKECWIVFDLSTKQDVDGVKKVWLLWLLWSFSYESRKRGLTANILEVVFLLRSNKKISSQGILLTDHESTPVRVGCERHHILMWDKHFGTAHIIGSSLVYELFICVFYEIVQRRQYYFIVQNFSSEQQP
jgi:hypothetical protein